MLRIILSRIYGTMEMLGVDADIEPILLGAA